MARGYSTIEVLVATLICGLLILAVASKQLGMMTYMRRSYYHHIAREEALRIASAAQKTCTPASIKHWQQQVAQKLPGGQVNVEHCDGKPVVSIKWYLDDSHQVARQVTYRMS